MSENFLKFLFLGVMIALAIVGSKQTANKNSSVAALSGPPPRGLAISLGTAAVFSFPSSVFGGNAVSVPDAGADPSSTALRAAESPSFSFFYPTGISREPEVRAHTALLADMGSGEIYFEKNLGDRWPIASITKLVTATYAAARIAEDALVSVHDPISESAASSSSHSLVAGTYRVRDLLYAMLLPSSNASAEAIAQSYGRSEFLAGMNDLARTWGALETHFDDPTGISPANQSTGRDILKITQAIYAGYPQIFGITRTGAVTITEHASGNVQMLSSINLFAGRSDFLGGKTGYTDEASGNLLSVFSVAGRPVLVLVLGTDDRFGETEKLLTWFKTNFVAMRP